jgi:hypothetical protein
MGSNDLIKFVKDLFDAEVIPRDFCFSCKGQSALNECALELTSLYLIADGLLYKTSQTFL